MRAQVSIELFFVFSAFILVLLWLNNFVSVVRSDDTALREQARAFSAKVASAADSSCVLDTEVTVSLGCLISEKGLVPYRVTLSGGQASVSSVFGVVSSNSSFCDFTPGFVDVTCPGQAQVCMRKSNASAQFSLGGCLP